MTDTTSLFAELATRVYRISRKADGRAPLSVMISTDPFLRQIQSAVSSLHEWHPQFREYASQVLADSELAPLAHVEGELEPMILHAGGGSRTSNFTVLAGLISAAFVQRMVLRLPDDESTFVGLALENFGALRRALKGEQIRFHLVTGIGGIRLHAESAVTTPWGSLRSAMVDVNQEPMFLPFAAATTCVLVESRLLTVRFDRAPQPKHDLDPNEVANTRAQLLLPIAFALASNGAATAAVPTFLRSTTLLPFQSGFGYSFSFPEHAFKQAADVTNQVADIERWSATVEKEHAPSIDIAARRVVSALAHRVDRSDALIDAVMAWENLVGAETEVTFRVTAAIVKILESDRTKRRGASEVTEAHLRSTQQLSPWWSRKSFGRQPGR